MKYYSYCKVITPPYYGEEDTNYHHHLIGIYGSWREAEVAQAKHETAHNHKTFHLITGTQSYAIEVSNQAEYAEIDNASLLKDFGWQSAFLEKYQNAQHYPSVQTKYDAMRDEILSRMSDD